MRMRKLNRAQEIALLKNELANRTDTLEGKLKKLEKEGWTEADKETADRCAEFIRKNAPIVKAFYS